MFVLRFFVGLMVYLSIVGVILGTAYGGWELFKYSETLPTNDKYKEYYLYGSYSVGGLCLLLVLCVCCNCKNIRIGIAVMKCTAIFMATTP